MAKGYLTKECYPLRLAIFADTYPPIRISGAVQMRDLVRAFAEQGHEPTAIVAAAELERPWKVEQADGVTVIRVRTPPTKDVPHMIRAVNEARLPYLLLRGMRKAGVPLTGWDGVIWYSPTIFLGPAIQRVRRTSGCRSYLILRDIFPEWAVDTGLMGRGIPYWYFKWIESTQYANADIIGVQCEANLPYLAKIRSHNGRTLEVLENWLSPAPISTCSINLAETILAGRTIFVYTGNMGVAQGMDVFLDLAVRMRPRRDVGFLFVGRGSEARRLAHAAARAQLDNVAFHDEIEPEEVPGLLAQCHVAMLGLDQRLTSHNVPGKFLTYMQAGLPVLARINPGNDLEKLITDEGVGRVCTDGGAESLYTLAMDLIANAADNDRVAERARALWKQRFSSTAAVRQIVRALTGDRHATPA